VSDYTDEELELIEQHRAAKRKPKSVRVRAKHDSGAEYEFDLDGDEADKVINRHRGLWSDDEDADDEPAKPGKGKADPKVVPAHFGRTRRSS
jgi:hypothetical protein